jgi:hypothetical protein
VRSCNEFESKCADAEERAMEAEAALATLRHEVGWCRLTPG